MKCQYTKKQLLDSIYYWKTKLKYVAEAKKLKTLQNAEQLLSDVQIIYDNITKNSKISVKKIQEIYKDIGEKNKSAEKIIKTAQKINNTESKKNTLDALFKAIILSYAVKTQLFIKQIKLDNKNVNDSYDNVKQYIADKNLKNFNKINSKIESSVNNVNICVKELTDSNEKISNYKNALSDTVINDESFKKVLALIENNETNIKAVANNTLETYNKYLADIAKEYVSKMSNELLDKAESSKQKEKIQKATNQINKKLNNGKNGDIINTLNNNNAINVNVNGNENSDIKTVLDFVSNLFTQYVKPQQTKKSRTAGEQTGRTKKPGKTPVTPTPPESGDKDPGTDLTPPESGNKDPGTDPIPPESGDKDPGTDSTPPESGDDDDVDLSEEKKQQKRDAYANPVDTFSFSARFSRAHNAACTKVKEALGKYLKKHNTGKVDSVIIENSCVLKDGRFDINKREMFIEIKVLMNKAELSSFRKWLVKLNLFTDISESEKFNQLDEDSFWKSMFSRKSRRKNLNKVTSKLRALIGIRAMQEYVLILCGKKLAGKISDKNVFCLFDADDKEGAQISYLCYIKLEN